MSTLDPATTMLPADDEPLARRTGPTDVSRELPASENSPVEPALLPTIVSPGTSSVEFVIASAPPLAPPTHAWPVTVLIWLAAVLPLPASDSRPPSTASAANEPAVPSAFDVPVSASVPAPVLRNAPAAATSPENVAVPPACVTSSPPPAAPTVKPRSVAVAPAPVIARVPPEITRLPAAADAAPSGLATPPSASVATSNRPPPIVVVPV